MNTERMLYWLLGCSFTVWTALALLVLWAGDIMPMWPGVALVIAAFAVAIVVLMIWLLSR